MDLLKRISEIGIVPVIQIERGSDAVPLCAALDAGGLPVAEITFRTDAAEEAIRNVARELPQVLLGAGTVLTVEQARRAVDAGARFIVSPGLNPEVASWCVEHEIPVLPGCATPSDIERALSLGIKTVKFFPAEALGGLKLMKAMSAPYREVRFVPTGGIDPANLTEYLGFDRVVAVGGSWMTPQDAVRRQDWNAIRALAEDAVNRMLGLAIRHIGVNDTTDEDARRDAIALANLMGWKAEDRGGAWFAGDGFEVMKKPGRGAKGHIAIVTNSVERAMFQWKKRGFVFEDEPVTVEDGVIKAIYLKDQIGGFAIHLLAK